MRAVLRALLALSFLAARFASISAVSITKHACIADMRGYSSLGDRDDLPVSSSTCAACNAMRGADTALGAQGTPKTSFPLPGDFHDLPMHALCEDQN